MRARKVVQDEDHDESDTGPDTGSEDTLGFSPRAGALCRQCKVLINIYIHDSDH